MSTASSSFYIAGGSLWPDSPSYVERQADRDLYDGLIKGDFCYVLAARTMGKSSLMVRTARRLQQHGINVVRLNLSSIGWNVTPEQWYDSLNSMVGHGLRLQDEVDEFWQTSKQLPPLQRFMTCLRDVMMPQRPGPIVIFVDEIEFALSVQFSTDECFMAIRECYNRRTEDPEFKRLSFCLLGEAMSRDLIRDTRTTPFNIGRRIELTDFTPSEAAPLANGLGREGRVAARLFGRILYWTNGHPYLTQCLCRAVAEDPSANNARDVDRLCEVLFQLKTGDPNLSFVHVRLLHAGVKTADLLSFYDTVWRGKLVRDDEANPLVGLLRSSGVARVVGGRLQVRNRIYQRVFNGAWVLANMPTTAKNCRN